ncbi:uncharacterized protein LOC124292110 [Haliotis rubra]|uniref:uncharacterized protein LOC124292110 n=1 Tax=Haliotis rubra TaxID=36100 RepID=UPI001EE611D8|nr:uncharacterized protein LOC124292110 [Haliotis rubra]
MLSNNVVEVFVFWIYLVDISVSAPALVQRDICADHLSFCKDFEGWGCGGQYEEWASYNCAKTCGYCDKKGFVIPHFPYTVTQPVPSQQCVDEIPNCKEYGQSVCTDSQYKTWVQDNCASYCNLCDLVTD